jgi:hypothetical protein
LRQISLTNRKVLGTLMKVIKWQVRFFHLGNQIRLVWVAARHICGCMEYNYDARPVATACKYPAANKWAPLKLNDPIISRRHLFANLIPNFLFNYSNLTSCLFSLKRKFNLDPIQSWSLKPHSAFFLSPILMRITNKAA